jgi:hypothetical protein
MADAHTSYSWLFILLSVPILFTYLVVYVSFLLFPSFFLPFLLNAHLLADHARTGNAPSPRSSQEIDHCTYRATPPTEPATQ